jgi:Ca2+-binding EF-hand superfamily protein
MRSHHEITDQWLWSLFSTADEDHSGHLDRNEIRQLLVLLNIELDEQEIDECFNEANIRRNHYQELRSLDKEQFLMFYKFLSYRPELLEIICQ